MADHRQPRRSFRAGEPWSPSPADLARGRAALVEELAHPENLSAARYAEAAGLTPQQIETQIAGRSLLALEGDLGRRIPAWQLDPAVLGLTRTVLQTAADVDTWTIYQMLTAGMDAFDGMTPLEAAKLRQVDEVAAVVLQKLGVHGAM